MIDIILLIIVSIMGITALFMISTILLLIIGGILQW